MSDIKKAEKDYLKGMKYKDIAEKYNTSINTVKSWVRRYGWSEKKKGAHESEGCTQTKRGAPKGNKNAIGNSGGSAPKGNKNAETHGFFSKHFPQETLEIMKEIETKSPIDMLWENIIIQYTAIIRAQKIMFVEDKDDLTKYLKKEKKGDAFTEKEWEFQYAWDKHANFLKAQSQAMGQLNSLIKRYEELVKSDLVTEEQKLRIEKLKVEINNASGKGDMEDDLIDEWIEAVTDDE